MTDLLLLAIATILLITGLVFIFLLISKEKYRYLEWWLVPPMSVGDFRKSGRQLPAPIQQYVDGFTDQANIAVLVVDDKWIFYNLSYKTSEIHGSIRTYEHR